jgi:translation initiation factor 5A
MGDWEAKEIRELKIGRYVNIDESPCKIVSIDTSKPGKHGSAKAVITAIDIFTGAKKSLVGPVSTKCQCPIIDKRKGQVLAIHGNEIQIMDLETFENFTMDINADHESELKEGGEVMYIVAMDKMKLM